MAAGTGPKQSIFISYSHDDAAFVRDVVRELRRAGISVSYDEMERLQVGDVLTERLKDAIDRYDYLGVVLSPTAVNSTWVRQELQWAMDTEGAQERVKVLPLIAEVCEIPPFLRNKVQLDLSTPEARRTGLLALSGRLGGDFFEMTARLFPLLGSVAAEAQQGFVQTAAGDAIVVAGLPAEVLEPFLAEAVRRSSADGLVGLAVPCMMLVDTSDCCYEAAERAMRDPRLPGYGIGVLTAAGRGLKRVQAIEWWHDTFVDVFHNDAMYNSLIQAHGAVLLRTHYDSVANYLLSPNRGPGSYNIDSILAVLLVTDRSSPFVRRWIDWLNTGRLDGRGRKGDEKPDIHYACLVDGMNASPQTFEPIADVSIERVRYLLKSDDDNQFDAGIRHLSSMLERRVPFAGRVRAEILDRVDPDDPHAYEAIWAMKQAFQLLEQYHADRDPNVERELSEASRHAREAAKRPKQA